MNLTVDESFSMSEPVHIMNELLPNSLEIMADLTTQADGYTVWIPFHEIFFLIWPFLKAQIKKSF